LAATVVAIAVTMAMGSFADGAAAKAWRGRALVNRPVAELSNNARAGDHGDPSNQ